MWSGTLLGRDAQEQLYQFYMSRGLSIEVRGKLDPWIQCWFLDYCNLNPKVDHESELIQQLYTSFLNELDRQTRDLVSRGLYSETMSLNIARHRLEQMSPVTWYQSLRDCLNEEYRLYSDYQAQQPNEQKQEQVQRIVGQNHVAIKQRVDFLAQEKNNFLMALKSLVDKQTSLRSLRQQLASGNLNGTADYMNSCRAIIEPEESHLLKIGQYCQERSLVIIQELTQLVELVCTELETQIRWSCFPEDQFPDLDAVQAWYTGLLLIVLDLRKRLSEDAQLLTSEDGDIPFWNESNQLLTKLNEFYNRLVQFALVTQDQPPEVVKTKTKLKCENLTVRLLGETLISPGQPIKVEATVLNEDQAKQLWETKDFKQNWKLPACGPGHKLKNCVGQAAGQPGLYQFSNMTITDAIRPRSAETGTKKSQGILTSQFCLAFYSKITTVTGEHHIWCCSRSFVVIVGDGQMQEASGVALWNYLHDSPRVPFELPVQVTWRKLSAALNRFIQNRTKRKPQNPGDTQPAWNLTAQNLQTLGEKLFGSANFNDESIVSADKFLTKGGQHEFWDWFYQAVLVLEHHLAEYWNKGFIIGFIKRTEAESKVRSFNTRGTFLIRFQDSSPGSISIAILSSNDPLADELTYKNVGPISSAELAQLGIVGRTAEDHYQFVCHEDPQTGEIRTTSKSSVFVPEKKPTCRDEVVRKEYDRPELRMVVRFDDVPGTSSSNGIKCPLPPFGTFPYRNPFSPTFSDEAGPAYGQFSPVSSVTSPLTPAGQYHEHNVPSDNIIAEAMVAANLCDNTMDLGI